MGSIIEESKTRMKETNWLYGGRQSIDLASETEWSFTPVGGTRGSVPYKINVPGGGWYNQRFDSDSGIYERWIEIPDIADPHIIKLEFDALNFQSVIYLGDNPLCVKEIASAFSSWMPVILDITEYVKPGCKYFLKVFVKGREACSIMSGNCKEYTVPEGANWTYTMDSGILRGVHLRLYPLIHIEDVFVRTFVAEENFEADIWVRNASLEDINIDLNYGFKSTSDKSFNYPQPSSSKFRIKARTVEKITINGIRWELGKSSFWWPNLPYKKDYRAVLHLFEVELLCEGNTCDTSYVRFGFREFGYIGQYYYLNGVKIRLRGHNQTEADFNGGTNNCNDAYGTWPGFQPPSENNGGWPKAVDNYLKLNSNVLRFHQIPCTPYMLDVCDEMGLLIIMESSVRGDDVTWSHQYENMNAIREPARIQVREMVKRDRNHPSVIIWSVANEPWVGKEYEDSFIYEYNDIAREQDSTRVRMVDGMIHPMEGDIVPVKHYWDENTIVEWEDKPNGLGEYDQMHDEERTVKAMYNTKKYRLDPRIVDLRPWHITYVWTALIPGVRKKDVFIEGCSTVYRKINTQTIAAMLESGDFKQNQIDCKVVGLGAEVDIYGVLEDEEPWQHPLISLICNTFNPLAAFDVDLVCKEVTTGQENRKLIRIYNDTLNCEAIRFEWEVRANTAEGQLISEDRETFEIEAAGTVDYPVIFTLPVHQECEKVYLILRTIVKGNVEFEDKISCYTIKEKLL